ncbi:MAG: hypothetical protein ABI696_03120 [Rubrivivax sp.]
MSKPSNPSGGWALTTCSVLLALAAAGLGAGLSDASAGAGVSVSAPAGIAPAAAAAATSSGRVADGDGHAGVPAALLPERAGGWVRLRCWQYGRLLFDEGPVRLGADGQRGARLVAQQRDGSALVVTDAGSATCLARPAAAPPSLALPH